MAAAFAVAMPSAVVASGRGTAGGDAKSHRVFVYGTLKRGFYNHRLLEDCEARFVAEAKTHASMRLVLGDFGVPYVMDEHATTGTQITGELWEVNDSGLEALDVLEGVDVGMYQRVDVQVVVQMDKSNEFADGAESAWGYVTGPESVKRGVGDESCEQIEQYDLETHQRAYVPKHERPEGSLGARR